MESDKVNYVSGSLLTPFTKLHENLRKTDPYTTPESYMATIIHEFGHVYYESIKSSWFSNFNYNITLINAAKDLYEEKEVNLNDLEIKIPSHPVETEVFAFCTDYTAASIFWPEYKKVMDADYLRIIKKYLDREMNDKLVNEESVLDDYHIGASVIGRLLIQKYGDGWVNVILENNL